MLKCHGVESIARHNECHTHVRDGEGVVNELAASLVVLMRPIDICVAAAVASGEKLGASIAECIDEMRATATAHVIFELCAWTVKVAGVVERR